MSTALYIHIPFCVRKCAYCDFVSFGGKESQWNAYLAALEDELQQAARTYGRLSLGSVYFGGGTPSLLPSDVIMRLMAMIRAYFRPTERAEITVECNPGTLDRGKLRDYRDSGVNRLSLGAQSADASLLATLGRIHTWAQVEEAVELAKSCGFTNINLDLMYALPGQNMAQWVDTVQKALSLKPTHLSMYSLIPEDGTPLKARLDTGELTLPDDELCLSMQHAAQRIVARRDYLRYEISNYALSGYESRHNKVYWTRGAYLGLGLAAHSCMMEQRFQNTTDLDAYINGTREVSRTRLTAHDILEETIMLGTRMTEGIPLSVLRGCIPVVRDLVKQGFATTKNDRFALTERGMDVQNAVVLRLVEAL